MTWAMWVASLAGRSEYRTSARGQSQPVEIASLASTTRMSVSVWMDSGYTQSIILDPSTIGSCSPKTCAIAFGPRPDHSDSTTWTIWAILEVSDLSGTCITKIGSTLCSPAVSQYADHRDSKSRVAVTASRNSVVENVPAHLFPSSSAET